MLVGKGLRPIQVFLAILFVRTLSVFLVQTWYVPDEYWQTLEVAHKSVFGYGELTWEWQKGIRSYLYPGVVAAFYSLLKVTGLDYPEALIILPRLLQSLISTAADYSLYKWTGNRKWALFLILTSWFWFYTSSRTLLQTLETSLVAIALSVFPFQAGKSYLDQESSKWIWLAELTVFLRPTSLPLWVVLGLYNLSTTNQEPYRLLMRTYLPIGMITGGALVALDSFFYGRFIITPWEFIKFNVLHDVASFYGTHPWHWYLTQGLPAVLGINLIPVVWSAARVLQRPKENITGAVLLLAAALHIAAYSFIPHKEFRFVLPLLPIFLYLAQDLIVPWSRRAKKWQLYLVAGSILLGNAVPALYFGTIHQSGTLKVMPLIREATNNRSSVAFLMPCHSTPLYSHLHSNITARYLSCDPFKQPGSNTEAEAFFNNPLRWWKTEYSTRQTPTLVVLFDTLKGRIENILSSGYSLLHEIPHTQFPEGEVGEKVLVYKKTPSQPSPTAPPAPPADETV